MAGPVKSESSQSTGLIYVTSDIWSPFDIFTPMNFTLQGSKLVGAEGSLELFCGSLKFLQGLQKCTDFYTQHILVAFEDAKFWAPWNFFFFLSPALNMDSMDPNVYLQHGQV